MTIPDKPLEIDFDPKLMKVKEWRKLAHASSDPDYFVEFLSKHTNWTFDEIDEMTMEELGKMSEQFAEVVQRTSVPLQS